MVSVMLYPCILCVALLMDLFVLCGAYLTVFANCLLKLFAICLGVVVILLFNVKIIITTHSMRAYIKWFYTSNYSAYTLIPDTCDTLIDNIFTNKSTKVVQTMTCFLIKL